MPDCQKKWDYCTNADVRLVQLCTKRNRFDGEIIYACRECRKTILNGSCKFINDEKND